MKNPFVSSRSTKVPHRKHLRDSDIVPITLPTQVVISMQQHIGSLCTPLVKNGALVKVGQIIGKSDSGLKSVIHSSVSGKVKEIRNILLSDGRYIPAVVIDTDGTQTMSENIQVPVVESREDFLKAVEESGCVGLGGAGFPTVYKLMTPVGIDIDTLIINAAECEPYITVDYREFVERADSIAYGIREIQKWLGIKRAIVVTEDNKKEIVDLMKPYGIKVITLDSAYPKGAEKLLIYKSIGRTVPAGGFPYNVGVIVLNVNTVSFIASYLKTGIPLINKNITVDGRAIGEPKNLRVPIGTSIRDIAAFCGGYIQTPAKIIFGGPMMGTCVYTDDSYILKQHNCLLFFTQEEANIPEQQPCIRCGRCLDSCPMSLMPCELAKAHKLGDYEAMKQYSIMSCIECGSCAFSCPAGRSLVQIFRLAKAEMKRRGI